MHLPSIFCLLLVASSLSMTVNCSTGKASNSLASLEQELFITQIEIRQLQLNLVHSKALAHYGWRENLNQRMTAWRSSLRSVFTRIANTFRSFITSLTTRDGDRLPPWIYSAFSGALDDILKYLEKQMETQDDHFRATLLEILRNTVRIYRNKIRNSGASATGNDTLTASQSTGKSNSTTGSSEATTASPDTNEITNEKENTGTRRANSPNRKSSSDATAASEEDSDQVEGKEDTFENNSWAELEENWDRDLHDDTLDI